MAFHSRKFDVAEINYTIHDKELLEIVDSFTQWRHFLEGSSHQVTVFSDHKNLVYFQDAVVKKTVHERNRCTGAWEPALHARTL